MENRAEKPLQTMMLMLTDSCNLRCRYCYENNRKNRVMKAEEACALLDESLSGPNAAKSAWRIEFFGGETLLAFPAVRAIYNHVQQTYPHLEKYYAITTNGTVFDEEKKAWFRQHGADFCCTLSLDGTPAMHNLNRRTAEDSPTWDMMDLSFVKEVWPGAVVKMTVSEQTLPYLAEGIRYIEDLGFYCKVSLASGIRWDAASLTVLYGQLQLLVDQYLEHSESPLCSFLNLPLGNLDDADTAEEIRFCDAGLTKRCFDMAGDDYPCQGLTPVAAGSGAIRMAEWTQQLAQDNEGDCKACAWQSVCPTCYAANRLETGCLFQCDHMTCLMHRLCILAASYVQFLRLEPRLDSNALSEGERKQLRGIAKVQEIIPEIPEIAAILG